MAVIRPFPRREVWKSVGKKKKKIVIAGACCQKVPSRLIIFYHPFQRPRLLPRSHPGMLHTKVVIAHSQNDSKTNSQNSAQIGYSSTHYGYWSMAPINKYIYTYMRDWGNPGSTRNLQPLLFLFFAAWRTRQVGARFDGEPSDGNDRITLRQRKVLRRQSRESTEITCQRETWWPASLSSESTETPRPLLVQQDTISNNTSGTATVHTNLHEKICLRNGRKCTCDPYMYSLG